MQLIAVGTSHTTDRHGSAEDLESFNYYPNLENGEQRWIEYLAEQLNVELIDMSLGGYGINTYFTRLLSVLKDNKPDIALIEMPTVRMEIYADKHQDPTITLDKEFWKYQGNVQQHIYCYTVGDTSNSVDDIKKTTKFKSINNGTDIPFTPTELDTLHSLLGKYNYNLLHTQQFAQFVAIDNWLKNFGIKTFWWSWNFPVYEYNFNYSPFDLIVPNGTTPNIEQCQFGLYATDKLNYNKQNKEHFYDGVHLNSKLWKQLVDEHFVPYLKEKIN